MMDFIVFAIFCFFGVLLICGMVWEVFVQKTEYKEHLSFWPVRRAASCGLLEDLKAFKKQGVDLHNDFEAALRFASMKGHLEVVKFLVEDGADLSDWAGTEALENSLRNGHINVSKYLMSQGVKVNLSEVFK